MDGRLVLAEQLKLCLRHRVAFDVNFEAMRWFQWTLGSRIHGPLDIAVLRLVDRSHHIEVAFAVLFLPG